MLTSWPRPSVRNSPSQRSQGHRLGPVAMLAEGAQLVAGQPVMRWYLAPLGEERRPRGLFLVDVADGLRVPQEPGYAVAGQVAADRLGPGGELPHRQAGAPGAPDRVEVGDQDQEVPVRTGRWLAGGGTHSLRSGMLKPVRSSGRACPG